jgi:hypothetical protein
MICPKMRSRHALLFLFLGTIGCDKTAAPAQTTGPAGSSSALVTAKTKLRYQFKEGDTFSYLIAHDVVARESHKTGSQSKASAEMSLRVIWAVEAVDAGGRAKLKCKVEYVRVTTENSLGIKAVVDSNTVNASEGNALFQLLKHWFTFTCDATGNIADFKVPAILDKHIDAGFAKSVFMPLHLVMPPDAVGEGASWKAPPLEITEMPGASFKILQENTFTLDRRVQKGSRQLENVLIAQNVRGIF